MKAVSQLHIKLPDSLHNKVKREAKKMDFSVQEFSEKALHIASELGLEELYAIQRSKNAQAGKFTFIDLFAGIGGIRLAFEAQGGKCVFSSEWDRFAQKTYFENFKEVPKGDITKIDPASITSHDVLVAGFPCQPFSISGISKKNSLGRAHGFLDKTQGTLFFNIVKILDAKRPKMFLLENVKHLKNHDKGNTFRVISGVLDELDYAIFPGIIDAQNYVPQHRERIYIVGFDREVFGKNPTFEFPVSPKKNPKLKSILDKNVDDKYILTDHLWQYLQNYAAKHRAAGHGFGFGLVNEESISRTLSARYHKDGSEILIERKGRNPRRLTPRECARLMGYPPNFRIPVSDTQAYRQFGNSVVVPVVTAIAQKMMETYSEHFKTASE